MLDHRHFLHPHPHVTTGVLSRYWIRQVNRYNLRGLAMVYLFAILAVLHLALAACAEAQGELRITELPNLESLILVRRFRVGVFEIFRDIEYVFNLKSLAFRSLKPLIMKFRP